MAATLRTDALAAGWSQATLVAKIKEMLLAANWGTLVDEFTASNRMNLVFQVPVAQGSDKTCFHRIFIDPTPNHYVGSTLSSAWNSSTHVGTNETTANSSSTLSTSSNVNLFTFEKANGFRDLLVQQGAVYWNAGYAYISPPSWWDRTLYAPVLAMNFSNAQQLAMIGSTGNPYGSSTYVSVTMNNALVTTLNPRDNKRQVVSGFIVHNAVEVISALDADLCMAAASGLVVGDVISVTDGSEEYMLIQTANSSIAIRYL